MAHCITSAPRKPDAAPVPPLKPDGSSYEWGIRLPGNVHIGWADSIGELAGLLVGQSDYIYLTAQEQAYHRIRSAVRLQVTTQARINFLAQAVLGHWDKVCQWEREVLNGPRHVQPHGFQSAPLFDGRDVWTCPIPLILVSTAYAPFSEVQPIEGPNSSLWWIDPSANESLLDSLVAEPLRLIDLWRIS